MEALGHRLHFVEYDKNSKGLEVYQDCFRVVGQDGFYKASIENVYPVQRSSNRYVVHPEFGIVTYNPGRVGGGAGAAGAGAAGAGAAGAGAAGLQHGVIQHSDGNYRLLADEDKILRLCTFKEWNQDVCKFKSIENPEHYVSPRFDNITEPMQLVIIECLLRSDKAAWSRDVQLLSQQILGLYLIYQGELASAKDAKV